MFPAEKVVSAVMQIEVEILKSMRSLISKEMWNGLNQVKIFEKSSKV